MARGAFVNPLNPEVFPGVCKMEAEVNNIQDSQIFEIFILILKGCGVAFTNTGIH